MGSPRVDDARLSAQALYDEGARCLARGDHGGALTAFRIGAARFPERWQFPCDAATVLYRTGAIAEAVRLLTQALRLAPRELLLHFKLGSVLLELGRPDAALPLFERAVELSGGKIVSLLHLGVACLESRNVERAAEVVERAIARAPKNADAHALRGLVLASLGRRAESDEALKHALALDPACAQAAYQLARRGIAVEPGPIAARLRRAGVASEERGRLCYALGNVYDRRGDHSLAFWYFQRANVLKARRWSPDPNSALIDQIIATCTRDLFAERAEPALGGHAPVFIVGLPRTGSTLLERMLSEHPGLRGIGEHSAGIRRIARELPSTRSGVRPYPSGILDLSVADRAALARRYLASVDAECAPETIPTGVRALDKLLWNHQALALIALLFPDAKVLNCRRDPRDSGLSSYFIEFQRNELPWTYDLEHVARYYRDHDRLDRHWKAHLPLDVLDVPYEALVADPVGWQRRALDFLGLEWVADCMRYDEAASPVFTASALQVREKPHTRAVERWRPYAAHLGPLADVAAEWGYST